VKELAQGSMMLGVLLSAPLTGLLAARLFERAGEEPPKAPPDEQHTDMSVVEFAGRATGLLTLILAIIALAFGLQALLLRLAPGLRDDHVPVIILAYLLGGAYRFVGEIVRPGRFPEKTLTVLLLGPTMSLVLTYALGAMPLHTLALLTPQAALTALLAVAVSAAGAWLAFPLLARLTDRYYAAVVATALFAVTTGWGPLAMAYLRRFTTVEGPAEPMPAVLPLNAMYLYPWMVILLTRLLLGA
jgi:sodium--glutamate symport carrier gltS